MSFLPLTDADIVVSTDSVVYPCWSDNESTLSSTDFYTSSLSNYKNQFYLSVFQTASTVASAEVQFNISYGNKDGNGTTYFNNLAAGYSPSKVTYGQYRTLIYGDENTDFNFGGTADETEFFVINIARDRYKQHLQPGSLTLKLDHDGNVLYLTDDSQTVTTNTYLDCGRVFNIKSGSAGDVTGSSLPTTIGNYGLFLPDVGLIVLSVSALEQPIENGGILLDGVNRNPNNDDQNTTVLFDIIKTNGQFTLLSEEAMSSNYIFVRVPNQEFNYSLNPSMISGSGELVYSNFIQSPQTFMTTIGLYNDNNELLAVGKTSKPIVKDFTKEALIRVKLNW